VEAGAEEQSLLQGGCTVGLAVADASEQVARM
jgi:hypothetical protein